MEISGGSLLQVDDELRDAERALVAVNNSVDTMREQIAKIAADLNRAERGIERIRDASLAWFLSFGDPRDSSPSEELTNQVKAGLETARKMGLPREIPDIDAKWTLA